MDTNDNKNSRDAEAFAKLAHEAKPGMLVELWAFLRCNKKWWLSPIIAILLLVGLLIILSGSAAGPFIYTLF